MEQTSGASVSIVPRVIEEVIHMALPDVEVVSQNDFDAKPELPYVTFAVIDPFTPHSYNNNNTPEAVSMQIQLGVHGHHEFETLDNAFLIRTKLEDVTVREKIQPKGVDIEKVIDVYSLPKQKADIAWEFVAGIDVQVSYKPKQVMPTLPEIDHVDITKK